MRNEKKIIVLLRNMFNLLKEECNRNPDFLRKFEAILIDANSLEKGKKQRQRTNDNPNIPDIYEEWKVRDETSFRLWLIDHSPTVLQLIIKNNSFDPSGRTRRWKESEKLADYIIEKIQLRSLKGSFFMRRNDESTVASNKI